MSYEHAVCSKCQVNVWCFMVVFLGSVGADRIHPGRHYGAEEIWRTST